MLVIDTGEMFATFDIPDSNSVIITSGDNISAVLCDEKTLEDIFVGFFENVQKLSLLNVPELDASIIRTCDKELLVRCGSNSLDGESVSLGGQGCAALGLRMKEMQCRRGRARPAVLALRKLTQRNLSGDHGKSG